MKDYEYYIGSLISASLSFVQNLIPIIQLILLLISLILSLMGIVKQLKQKIKEGKDISEDLNNAKQVVDDTFNKIKEGNENDKGKD